MGCCPPFPSQPLANLQCSGRKSVAPPPSHGTQGISTSGLCSCQAPLLECTFFLPLSFKPQVLYHRPQEASPALLGLPLPCSAENHISTPWEVLGLVVVWNLEATDRIYSNILIKMKNTSLLNPSMSLWSPQLPVRSLRTGNSLF